MSLGEISIIIKKNKHNFTKSLSSNLTDSEEIEQTAGASVARATLFFCVCWDTGWVCLNMHLIYIRLSSHISTPCCSPERSLVDGGLILLTILDLVASTEAIACSFVPLSASIYQHINIPFPSYSHTHADGRDRPKERWVYKLWSTENEPLFCFGTH